MTPFDEDLQRVRAAVLAAQTEDELLDALEISGLSSAGYWALIVWTIMKDRPGGNPVTSGVNTK